MRRIYVIIVALLMPITAVTAAAQAFASRPEKKVPLEKPKSLPGIDTGTISLQGSSSSYVLAGVYDDEEILYCAGDFGSVYTPTTLEETVTPPEGITPTSYYYNGTAFYGGKQHPFSSTVNVVKDGNDVYLQHIAYWFPDAWIKGTLSNGVATFPSGQFVGADEMGSEFLCTQNDNDIVFSYDEENQVFSLTSGPVYETPSSTWAASIQIWGSCEQIKIYKGEIPVPEEVEVPDGLETEIYVWTGNVNEAYEDEFTPFIKYINIGFDGNDVYVQGLCQDLPEAWVKGTIDGTTATFATGQYFGSDDRFVSWGHTFPHYFVGFDGETVNDVVFTFDPEAKSFVTEDYIYDSEENNLNMAYLTYNENAWNVMQEIAAKPANPEFIGVILAGAYPYIQLNIPKVDVDGNFVNINKLYYRLFSDVEQEIQPIVFTPEDYEYFTEALTEIPYTYDDNWDIYEGGALIYMNQGSEFLESLNRIGVQSVYYGGQNLSRAIPTEVADNESDIVWYDIKAYVNTGVITNLGTNKVQSVRYYNVGGMSSDTPFDGVNIVVTTFDNGTRAVTKIVK